MRSSYRNAGAIRTLPIVERGHPGCEDVGMVTGDDVRRAALALPETTEKLSYGTPGFRVKDKLFARIREEGDVLVVWCEDLGSSPSC
jgi:hypothetical protein